MSIRELTGTLIRIAAALAAIWQLGIEWGPVIVDAAFAASPVILPVAGVALATVAALTLGAFTVGIVRTFRNHNHQEDIVMGKWIPMSKKDAEKAAGDTAKFGVCNKCGRQGVFIYQSKGWGCKYC